MPAVSSLIDERAFFSFFTYGPAVSQKRFLFTYAHAAGPHKKKEKKQ